MGYYRAVNCRIVLFILGVLPVRSQDNAGLSSPNVIVIYTDDQRENSLRFTGGEVYTPRIDPSVNLRSENSPEKNHGLTGVPSAFLTWVQL